MIPRDDDVTFGVLSSRFHTVWALAMGGRMGHGNDPRYNSTMTFETFPFPPGLQPNRNALTPTPLPEGEGLKAAIADAAQKLNELRETWLNPSQWVDQVRSRARLSIA
ncbi:MAG: type IIL restriction-modification enzyme MmeI [Candidatus Competibacteraceae bacterium]